jgi:hypothetical protein
VRAPTKPRCETDKQGAFDLDQQKCKAIRHCIALVEQHSEVSMMFLTDKKRLLYKLVILPQDFQVCK